MKEGQADTLPAIKKRPSKNEPAKMIQDTLMNHTFNFDDNFYDADNLKHSWY